MQVFIVALLLQYVVSVKAGLVNHVQGTANVSMLEEVRAGHSIKTGADGYVEILLRPGSFLRLGENSEAMLDDTELASVKVTLVHGPALIETDEINKDHPITMTTGNLTTKVIDTGIYKFEDGVATVLQGKLETGDDKLTYEKGWEVFFQDNYRARKTGRMQETSLDVYSQSRSGVIANANFSVASSLVPTGYSNFDVWLFSPRLRLFTYIPRSDYRSPYGYRNYSIGGARNVVRNGGYPGVSSGTTNNTNTNTPDNNANNNNNNTNVPVAAAPAPTASTPSGERSTPATYVDSKNTAVGATVR